MDRFYCRSSARSDLHAVISRAQAEENAIPALCTKNLEKCSSTPAPTHEPAMLQLVRDDEETVYRIFGLVSVRSLPPFPQRFHEGNPPKEYLKQQVVVTGLGDDLFEDQVLCLSNLAKGFETTPLFLQKSLADLQHSAFEQFSAICAGTRLFVNREAAPSATEVPFEDGVDDRGLLTAFKADNLTHTTDNVVEYREQRASDSGIRAIKPSAIQVGDLIELHICIRWPLIGQSKLATVINLLRVTKISDSHRRAALALRRASVRSTDNSPQQRVLKRPRLPPLAEDGVEHMRQNLNELHLPHAKRTKESK
ncbi:hypothetical protein NP233_g8084 [Leucocoprinus birnbaumii]|uniref:Uncharacterized protein n=1 Tax=Leucocoprinus birnbaumii TaxID=56174 RepID=A0AAD5VMZ2_9AGAR|nr:hypothetical protein NP233_g8084 [Leucocoprinus birnbaumii]